MDWLPVNLHKIGLRVPLKTLQAMSDICFLSFDPDSYRDVISVIVEFSCRHYLNSITFISPFELA